MRNAHHMNAPGACSVQTARSVTRGENWQFLVPVVWLFQLLKWAMTVSFQLPGSHLLRYLIPGDVLRCRIAQVQTPRKHPSRGGEPTACNARHVSTSYIELLHEEVERLPAEREARGWRAFFPSTFAQTAIFWRTLS